MGTGGDCECDMAQQSALMWLGVECVVVIMSIGLGICALVTMAIIVVILLFVGVRCSGGDWNIQDLIHGTEGVSG